MNEKKIAVGIPLDPSGFLRQECPYCKKEFKVIPAEEDDPAALSEFHCPYCGQDAPTDEFLTQAQVDYFTAIAYNEVIDPLLKDFQRDVKKISRSSGGLLDIKFRTQTTTPQEPPVPHDDDDLSIVRFPCCDLRIKVENPDDRLHCVRCGKPSPVERL